jgi:hypothetical protein
MADSASLRRQEIEHICRGNRHRVIRDNGAERLQVKGHRPQRSGTGPHEVQMPVHQAIAQPIPDWPDDDMTRTRHGKLLISATSQP